MKGAAAWIMAAVAAVPMAVLAHECGHVAAAMACGLGGNALHYASATYSLEQPFWSAYRETGLDSAATVVAPWKVAVELTGGLVLPYVMVVVGIIIVARTPHPLAVATAVVPNVRSLLVALSVAATWGRDVVRGSDEAHLAAITGIPEALLIVLGLTALIASVFWVFARVPRRERTMSVLSTIAGVAAGMMLYFLAGPHLLP